MRPRRRTDRDVKVFLFCLALLVPVAASSAPRAESLTFAADPWCPYNCTPGSAAPGYLIEILQAAFEPQGFSVTYISLPWSRAIRSALDGEIDGAIGTVRGNASGTHLGEQMLGTDETVIVTRRGEGFDYDGVASLANKRLGVITDYTYDNHGPIDRYIEATPEKIERVFTKNALERLFLMLGQGRVDAILENRFVALYTARNLGMAGDIEIVPTGASDRIFVGFSPDSKGRLLAKILDEAIMTMRDSGALTQILDKYGLPDWKKNDDALTR